MLLWSDLDPLLEAGANEPALSSWMTDPTVESYELLATSTFIKPSLAFNGRSEQIDGLFLNLCLRSMTDRVLKFQ